MVFKWGQNPSLTSQKTHASLSSSPSSLSFFLFSPVKTHLPHGSLTVHGSNHNRLLLLHLQLPPPPRAATDTSPSPKVTSGSNQPCFTLQAAAIAAFCPPTTAASCCDANCSNPRSLPPPFSCFTPLQQPLIPSPFTSFPF